MKIFITSMFFLFASAVHAEDVTMSCHLDSMDIDPQDVSTVMDENSYHSFLVTLNGHQVSIYVLLESKKITRMMITDLDNNRWADLWEVALDKAALNLMDANNNWDANAVCQMSAAPDPAK